MQRMYQICTTHWSFSCTRAYFVSHHAHPRSQYEEISRLVGREGDLQAGAFVQRGGTAGGGWHSALPNGNGSGGR